MGKLGVIIVAAGAGVRMGGATNNAAGTAAGGAVGNAAGAVPKQFRRLAGKPMLAHSVEAFESVDCQIVVVLPEVFLDWDVGGHRKCVGGATRFESVQRGLAALDADADMIAVHDAARPLVSKRVILNALQCAERYTSGVPAVAVVDSIRRMTTRTGSSKAEDRTAFRAIQTPQIFRADLLRKAYQTTFRESFTDDAAVFGAAGYRVVLSRGDRHNIKVTEPVDFAVAEVFFAAREAEREAELEAAGGSAE